MQTDATTLLLESTTAQLGDQFREFIQATDTIETVELAREAKKSGRSTKTKQPKKKPKKKQAKKQANKKPETTPSTEPAPTYRIVHPIDDSPTSVAPDAIPAEATPAPSTTVAAQDQAKTRRPKKMNIATVKFHALGHYPSTIRFFGPTDLYSTEWVSSLVNYNVGISN